MAVVCKTWDPSGEPGIGKNNQLVIYINIIQALMCLSYKSYIGLTKIFIEEEITYPRTSVVCLCGEIDGVILSKYLRPTWETLVAKQPV